MRSQSLLAELFTGVALHPKIFSIVWFFFCLIIIEIRSLTSSVLMAAESPEKRTESKSGISSVLLYHATVIIHGERLFTATSPDQC